MIRGSGVESCIGLLCPQCKRNDDARTLMAWTLPACVLQRFWFISARCNVCSSRWATWPWLEHHTGLVVRRIRFRNTGGFTVPELAALEVLALTSGEVAA